MTTQNDNYKTVPNPLPVGTDQVAATRANDQEMREAADKAIDRQARK